MCFPAVVADAGDNALSAIRCGRKEQNPASAARGSDGAVFHHPAQEIPADRAD